MRHLNYNHLYYFWVVSTTGSIAKAARSLHVTPQTISGQLRTLEARVGSPLFHRSAAKLALSETGQLVHSYVDPMFTLGWELGEVLKKRAPRRLSPLSVGVATGVGKSIASRMLGSVLAFSPSARVRCRETPKETLMAALLARELDLAVTDAAVPSSDAVRIHSYLVGQCGTTFLCATPLAERYRPRFPASLDGAPFMMPAGSSALARSLVDWFRVEQVAPWIVAEIECPDLASSMCETYAAVFALPTAIALEAERKYGVSAVGEVPSLEQQFYMACADGPTRHENVLPIVERARERFRREEFAS